ncbi:MAG: hypothetical protein KIG70_03520 [Treponema sp.]|uniref:hypothetical protein n=1 Tax=Treponema sp. TaxID=166 RepID=UPI001D43A191|nr:hypothetical protein [Treponema sp.]MBS7310237.1 hypothetical protein [Treponema sp.]
MTSGQKTAVSLLISVVLFAAFVVAAFTGLFSVIDARFYEPGKISQIQKHLDTVSENFNEYIETLESRFGKNENSFLKQTCVQSYIENQPSDEVVRERSKLSGDLFSQTPGLLGMRLIDKNGSSVHFSTFSSDVLNRTSEIVSFKNYTDAITLTGEKEIPFEKISSPDSYGTNGVVCKTVFDGRDNRIILSFPYYDSYKAYRGTFVFYVNANDFNRVLLSKKIITFGDTGSLVSGLNFEEEKKETEYKSGFVFGIPAIGKKIFEQEILSRWEKGLFAPEKIVYKSSEDSFAIQEYDAAIENKKSDNNYWVLVSSTKTDFGYIGGIYPDEMFAMPDAVKILLLICIFVTLFLVVFLAVNLKQDDMVVIRERIRRLQLGIVSEYLKKKENVDWQVVSGKIAERRQDVTLEIIRSLGRKAKKHDKEVNELINRSWDELLAAMSVQVRKENNENGLTNAAEIKSMLEELLSSGNIKVQTVGSDVNVMPVTVKPSKSVPVTEQVQELDKVEKAEAVEELEEVEEAEAVEELEEVEDAEAVEELEEVEDAEAVEELEEVEDAEAVEELEEVENAEAVEEIETADLTSMETVDIDEFHDTSKSEKHNPEMEIESPADVEILNRKACDIQTVYDCEDDNLIDNFNVCNPDFSGLDTLDFNDEGNTNITQTDEKPAIIEEEVSLDEFGIENSKEQYDFEEEIGFGSVENPNSKKSEETVQFNVEPEILDFKSLDKKVEVKRNRGKKSGTKIDDSKYGVKNIQNQVQAANQDDDIVELSSCDVDIPFTLTQFGTTTTAPEELKPYVNVIHEDESGMYVIKTDGADLEPQNLDFKNLVDSVLRK